jgi:hypothetical protein
MRVHTILFMPVSIPADLQGCDPFLTIAAQAMVAEGEWEQTRLVERLLEMRAMPSGHLTVSDRALRLVAMGCLWFVEGGEVRVEDHLGTQRQLTADQLHSQSRRARSRGRATGHARCRVSRLPRRNIRAELRVLFRVIQLREGVDYTVSICHANEIVDPPRCRGLPLWEAMVDDGRKWQLDPLLVRELADLLSEPASVGSAGRRR